MGKYTANLIILWYDNFGENHTPLHDYHSKKNERKQEQERVNETNTIVKVAVHNSKNGKKKIGPDYEKLIKRF